METTAIKIPQLIGFVKLTHSVHRPFVDPKGEGGGSSISWGVSGQIVIGLLPHCTPCRNFSNIKL